MSMIYNLKDYRKNVIFFHDYFYKDRKSFIEKLKLTLCKDDYLDFLKALTDHKLYCEIDEDLQNLVDVYWNIRKE